MVLPTSLVVLSAVGACTAPAFACDTHVCSWLFRNGILFFSFCLFCIFWSQICLNCTCTGLFLVPVFCSLRRGVSRAKLCNAAAKGPRSQACLMTFTDGVLFFVFNLYTGLFRDLLSIMNFYFLYILTFLFREDLSIFWASPVAQLVESACSSGDLC